MKKIKILFLILIAILVCNCSESKKNSSGTVEKTTSKSTEEGMTINVSRDVIDLLNNENVTDISDYRNFDYNESKNSELYDVVYQFDKLTNLKGLNKILSHRNNNLEIDSLANTIPTSRDQLDSGLKTYYSLLDGKKDIGVKIPFLNTKLGKEEKMIQMYYLETKKIKIDNKEKIYGCGYSLILHIVKHKKSLGISDLPSLAASVQLNNNKNQVFYSLQTYGITGKEIVKYFNPIINEKFDVSGFAEMKKNVFGLHKALSDSLISKKLKFVPQDLTDMLY